MIENKRFTLSEDKYDETIFDNGIAMGIIDVVEKLNELAEENERLKFENETLKSNYQREIQSSIDFCNAYSKTNGELLEEIYQLKQKIEQLKQRCKELRNDLIDHSALINMLEKVKALNIEDMIWNTMGYKTQTEFDDDFADYREYAKKRWRE